MNGHPGGDAHTRYLIELSFLPAGSRWLDFGAGDGKAIQILKELGFSAQGIDLAPRSPAVQRGDFLHTDFPDKSFDGIISQCAFYVSGHPEQAVLEAGRLLRKGGKLVFSDVCFDIVGLLKEVKNAGFAVRHIEDLTEQWREYYLEALWREDSPCCIPSRKNCSYILLVCERM